MRIDEKLDEHGLVDVNERISHLPTKEEFYSKMDEVMGELKTIREQQTVLVGRNEEFDDRLVEVESRVGVLRS